MNDVLSALIPPMVVTAVVIYAVVKLVRSEAEARRRAAEPADKSSEASSG
ncbi:hypothetical protein [Sphaerisporangium sp. TRM90804]|nr:hypothetical protein [Sphaerisporangium sp. TRM90804]MDH2425876.1 hypothetical protein [Sphaerisporangium sp. TRM90804]